MLPFSPFKSSWLRRRFKSESQPKNRLRLESLEDRLVLTGGSGISDLLQNAVIADNGTLTAIAWQANDASGSGIYMQAFNHDGTQKNSTVLVNTTTTGDQQNPAIGSNSQTIIAWETDLQDGNGYDIYAQKFNSNLAKSGAEFRVNTTLTGDQRNASVAVIDSSKYVVAWESTGPGGTDIYARFIGGTGTEFRVNSIAGGVHRNPVALASGTGFTIAYDEEVGTSGVFNTYINTYNSAGALTKSAVLVENSPPIAVAGSSYSVVAGTRFTLDALGSFDPDEKASLIYSWDLNGDGQFGDAISVSAATIVQWSTLSSLGITGTPQTSQIRVKVIDQYGAATISDPVTLTILPNQAPININTNSNSTIPYIIYSGGNVSVNATATNAAGEDFQDITKEWDINGDGIFGDTSASGSIKWADIVALGLDHSFGTRIITVRMTDPLGLSATASTTLTIAPNPMPIADAGGPYIIPQGNQVTLSAIGSIDNSDIKQYSWDLNGDGVYGDVIASNYSTTVTWAQLQAIGIGNVPEVRNISVKETDSVGQVSISPTTTLTIIAPTPPLVSLPAPYQLLQGTFLTTRVLIWNPTNLLLTYTWDLNGDGVFDDYNGTSTQFSWAQLTAAGLGAPGTTNISVRVTTNLGGTTTATSTLTILPDHAPTAVAVVPPTLLEGQTLLLSTALSSDPDANDDMTSASWDINGDGIFGDANGSSVALTWAQVQALGIAPGNVLNVRVKIADDYGLTSTSAASTLTIIANSAPTAVINGPYTVTQGNSIVLSAAGSIDPDAHAISYAWDLDGDGEFNDGSGVGQILSWERLKALGLINPGDSQNIRVKVTDSLGASTISAWSTLTVAATVPPVAATGGPYSVTQGGVLTLNASGSYDPDSNGKLSYSWDVNGDGVFDDATGATLSLSWAQLNGLGITAAGSRTLQLRVTDNAGASAVASDSLTVIANGIPIAQAGGPYTVTPGNSLALNALGSSDPDGQALSYAWDVNGDGVFNDASGANPTLTWSALQALGIGAGQTHNVRVSVTDTAGATTISAATTLITQPLSAVANAGGPYTILQHAGIRLDASASQALPGTTIQTYDWDLNGDGTYGDVTTTSPVVSLNPISLAALGIGNNEGTFSLRLRVTLSNGQQYFSDPTVIRVLSNVSSSTPLPLGTFTPNTIVGTLNNTLYFTATDTAGNQGLWKTDGTVEGTVYLSSQLPGSSSAIFGNYLYFSLSNTAYGRELWRTDGTAAGTTLVKNINPGSTSSTPTQLVVYNGLLYFAATDPANGTELWQSDGTAAGTVLAADITPGPASSSLTQMVVADGLLYFKVGSTLWSSDGTTSGSMSLGRTVTDLYSIEGHLYFTYVDNGVFTYADLSRNIGTAPSTQFGTFLDPWSIGGGLFYTNMNSSASYYLFKDGTQIGQVNSLDVQGVYFNNTIIGSLLSGITDINTGTTLIPSLAAYSMTVIDNQIYFVSGNSSNTPSSGGRDPLGSELWVTDGTAGGTYRVGDILQGTSSFWPTSLTPLGDGLIFIAQNRLFYMSNADLPKFANVDNQTVNEGSSIALNLSATGRGVTFSLAGDAPQGAAIDPLTGLFTWTPTDSYSDPVSITVLATTLSGAVGSTSFMITVNNVAPTLVVDSPTSALRGEIVSFTLSPSDVSSIDQSSNFMYHFDWDGNGTDDYVVSGPAGYVVKHAFVATGANNVKITSVDKDGGVSSVVTRSITVDAWRTMPDPSNPSLTNLIWSGTPGKDIFSFAYTALDQITVTTTLLNGVATSASQVFNGITGHLIAYGQQGDDKLDASSISGHMVELRGNGGNDTIIGGGSSDLLYGDSDGGEGGNDSIVAGDGNDVVYADGSEGGSDTVSGGIGDDEIFGDPTQGAEGGGDLIDGGDGNDLIDTGLGMDTITGGAGIDVLIGGKDADSITGGSGQDLIITSGLAISFYASGGAGVQQLWNQWRTSDPIAMRIAYLSGTPGGIINPSYVLSPGTNVTNDNAVDTVVADDDVDSDWILADISQDVLHDAIDDYFTDL